MGIKGNQASMCESFDSLVFFFVPLVVLEANCTCVGVCIFQFI